MHFVILVCSGDAFYFWTERSTSLLSAAENRNASKLRDIFIRVRCGFVWLATTSSIFYPEQPFIIRPWRRCCSTDKNMYIFRERGRYGGGEGNAEIRNFLQTSPCSVYVLIVKGRSFWTHVTTALIYPRRARFWSLCWAKRNGNDIWWPSWSCCADNKTANLSNKTHAFVFFLLLYRFPLLMPAAAAEAYLDVFFILLLWGPIQ